MHSNNKASLAVCIVVSITTTMMHGSEKKPNNRNYTSVQKLAALEQGSLSPRNASAENSPKSRTSIELVQEQTQKTDFTLPLSHAENTSPALDNQEVAVRNTCSKRCFLKYSCGALFIAGVITVYVCNDDINKALGLT